MQHYVFLGLNPSLKEKGKIALHVPLKDKTSPLKYQDIVKKLEKYILNIKTYSIYLLESSDETWKSVIEENKYFSSIANPIDSVDLFIEILNNVKLNSLDIAKYILKIEKCTHLRLQKLLYLVYSTYLKTFNKKLFEEKFVAWKYGPVNVEVFKYIKNLDNNVYNSTIEITNEEPDDNTKREFNNFANEYENISLSPDFENISTLIREVIDEYANTSTSILVELVHSKDSAWSKTNSNEEILDDDIINSKY